MFMTLLAVTFVTSLLICFLITLVFSKSIREILGRIVGDEIGHTWARYIKFAIYVVGVSGGVRIHSLEQYITPRPKEEEPIMLNLDRWVLELYRTIIGSLQAIAWMLLVFFVFSLIAFAIVRIFETTRAATAGEAKGPEERIGDEPEDEEASQAT